MRLYRIGIDEAGRGSVYGPLCVAGAAGVNSWKDDRIRDSKKVAPKLRYELAEEIRHHMLWAAGMISAQAINDNGIGPALRAAGDKVMKQLVAIILQRNPNAIIEVVFDGNDRQDGTIQVHGVDVQVTSVIKGDDIVFECSAASILAKTTHDRWVLKQVDENPDLAKYKLQANKGYGTMEHAAALIEHGLTRDHRTQFCETLIQTYKAKQAKEEPHESAHPVAIKRPAGGKAPAQRSISV